ncbi:hypothetical protein Trydic_g22585 [Trypoxylus dichotomus]
METATPQPFTSAFYAVVVKNSVTMKMKTLNQTISGPIQLEAAGNQRPDTGEEPAQKTVTENHQSRP